MPLETDFNTSPFFDDYDETKRYHRILFRPSVPVQARELTQLQTILQAQVERFGDNIYKQGTVIKGCSFSFDYNYQYVKILDLEVGGDTVLVSRYANCYVESTDNLKALIVNQVQGLQSQDPDLSTLFIKYLNTGTADKKQYSNSDTLSIYNRNYTIESIVVNSVGSGYDNTDVVVISGSTGNGAIANVVTYANGSVREISLSEKGSGYTTVPAVSITSANGTGANLTAINYLAQVTIANSSYTNPVGVGSAMNISDGIIYQKGNFIIVEDQTTIIDKYTNTPDGLVAGFYTQESVVNSSVDSTLLDNAQGYNNYTAPGAHRLKLTPSLIVVSTANAVANTDFFKLLEFENGRVTKRRTETEFNSIGEKLAKRTSEESGNYAVKPFSIYTEGIASNTTHLNVSVGSGLGYVDGYRVELLDVVRKSTRKGTDTVTSTNQTISTNYGNYVLVNEAFGTFDFSSSVDVNLRDTAATDITDNYGGSPTTPGNLLGTAKIRSYVHDSGTPGTPSATYKLYIYDIRMSAGKNFSSVKSIQSSSAVADTVLEDSRAVLKETNFDQLLFSTGTSAISFLENEQFVYRKVDNISFSTGGTSTILLTSVDKFPYTVSSTLNDTQEKDFIVIPQTNCHSSTSLTGTVTTSTNTVTGSGTSFINDFDVGDYIKVATHADYFRVASIANNTYMTLYGTGPGTHSGVTYGYAYPKNIPVRLDRGTANVQIDSSGQQATIYLGTAINTTTSVKVFYNVKVDGASAKAKSATKNVFVKISTDGLANTTGPWCLGIPDVYKINAVYVGTSNTYSNTTTNYVSGFQLVTGQNDNYYGLSYLKKKPGATLSLSNTNCLLVDLDLFTHGAGYYLSTESYPVDDITLPLPVNKIRTEEIPFYVSPKTGQTYSLRDVIDFRPIVANTANVSATSVASATIDPVTIETLSGTYYYPTPNESFEADITHYLGRIDRVVIDSFGEIKVVEGNPSNNPMPPKCPDSVMSLAMVFVPPYPSLSPKDAQDSGRADYSTLVKHDQVRRYTMSDIKQIDERITRLEYYSLFNTLEKNTKDLLIPSESNTQISRFKNGFFVDSFSSYDTANVNDPEFNIVIDTVQSVARPQIDQHVINLVANTTLSSNVTIKGDLALLDYTESEFISQPIANKYRRVSQTAWNYAGVLNLYPTYDNYYDIKQGAVSTSIDLSGPLNSLVNSINDSVTFKKDGKTVTTTVASESKTSGALQNLGTAYGFQGGNAQGLSFNGYNWFRPVTSTSTATTSTATTTTKIKPVGTNISTTNVGDFVTNFSLNNYIRSQWITFVAKGLRPNTRHYVFFDRVDVSAQARPATITSVSGISNSKLLSETNSGFTYTGAKGANLVSDANGVLVGGFYVAENTFFIGQRQVQITDVQNIDSQDSSISKATAFFNAYNFSKETATVSTKMPSAFTATSGTDVQVTTQRTTSTNNGRPVLL